MNILGINSFFEHPSIAIVSDGKLLFSIEDERLTKIKGGKRYTPYNIYVPFKSIYAGLKYLDMKIEDIDTIAYSYSKWDHFRGSFGSLTKKRLSSFSEEISAFIGLCNLKKLLGSEYELFQYMYDRISSKKLSEIPLQYYNHHLCHAASTFFCSGFKESLILAADGSGESACTSLYIGKDNQIKKLKQFNIPNSLGFVYSFVTKYLGFNPFSDEYKVMGLASYGSNVYENEFKKIISWDKNGNYSVNRTNLLNMSRIFGQPRKETEPLEERHKNIAKSLQVTLEKILVDLLSYYQNQTGLKNLCMAGGIALNCVANGVISESKIFDNIFVQPASSDAGTSIGAAALVNAKHCPLKPQLQYNDMYLGTSYSNEEVLKILRHANVPYKNLNDEEMIKEVAAKISKGQVGGVFRGRMEAGPRALGNRSVIASPVDPKMLEKINTIKAREMFRPIAPIVKENSFDKYFYGERNRYMLFTCKVRPEAKELIPAVTHVDDTSRVQVVSGDSNPFIHSLIDEFEKLTGVSVIINTSLNFKGQPIVEHPLDAIGSFYTSGLDFIVIENFLIEKGY